MHMCAAVALFAFALYAMYITVGRASVFCFFAGESCSRCNFNAPSIGVYTYIYVHRLRRLSLSMIMPQAVICAD